MKQIPCTCPDCGAIRVSITQAPPDEHERGEDWTTYAECHACQEYGEWFD